MNKFIFAAAAVATVAVTSGCHHTTVRTVRQPAEVVDTRTVIVDHRDDVYRERRSVPRVVEERVIERERVVRPTPVYVPPRYEPPRRYEERRYEERRYEEPRYPRPPAHSNSRLNRDEVREMPPRRVWEEERRRDHNAPPSRVIKRSERSVTRIIDKDAPQRREQDRYQQNRRDEPRYRNEPRQQREVRTERRERIAVPVRKESRPQPRYEKSTNVWKQVQQHGRDAEYQKRERVVEKVQPRDRKEKKGDSDRDPNHSKNIWKEMRRN